ncbi:MAG: MFS transporter [Novosphingobium sp.]|nr:MFS transporter [Novosphingobium sp.]
MKSSSADDFHPVRTSDWWALFLIVLAYSFYNLDKSLVSVLIEPIKGEFDLSDSQMGLMTGLATSVPFALACIPVGMLADRVNRRNLLAVLVAGWSAVTGLTSLAANVTALFASRIGIGLFEAGFTPVSLSSLSDRFPLRLRSTVMGLFSLGAAAGLFMGMAMGGFVADNWGWRAAFLIAGVPGLAIAALVVWTTSEPRRGQGDTPAASDGNAGLAAGLAHMMRDRALRHIALGMTWGAAMLAVFAVWTPSLLRRSFELSGTSAGLQSGLIVGIGGALGAAAGGVIADRIGRGSLARKLVVPMVGVTASTVAGLAALLGGGGAAIAGVLLGMSAFFCQFYIGTCYGLAATLAGSNRRGVTLSVLLVSFNLISYSLGSGLVGKVSDMLAPVHGTDSLRLAYAAAFAFCLVALFHFQRAHADLSRREGTGERAESHHVPAST